MGRWDQEAPNQNPPKFDLRAGMESLPTLPGLNSSPSAFFTHEETLLASNESVPPPNRSNRPWHRRRSRLRSYDQLTFYSLSAVALQHCYYPASQLDESCLPITKHIIYGYDGGLTCDSRLHVRKLI